MNRTKSAPAAPTELEMRVANRKRELIEELIEHKLSVRAGAAEASEKITARLTQLAHLIKAGVINGWANVGDHTRRRLDEWVAT